MSDTGQTASGPPRPTGAAPTLEEVAALAGVSRATVSRVVNGGQRVSPAALAAVEEAIAALRYTPNRAARSLVTRRADSVALLVPESNKKVFSDPFFAQTLEAVSTALADTDLQLVLLLGGPGDGGARTTRYLRQRNVDGAFVVSHHRHEGLADELADIGIPCVFGGRPWSGADRVSYVDVDNVRGGRLATERLIERGCRRIATIAGPSDMTASVDRLQGGRSALTAAGLSPDLVVEGDFTVEGGRQAAQRLLEQHPDIDGIVAGSDLMAVGALDAARAASRKVPDDLALIGYDDLGVAERSRPPLTTMRNPVAQMAEVGIAMLLDQLAPGSSRAPRRVVLPAHLVARVSA